MAPAPLGVVTAVRGLVPLLQLCKKPLNLLAEVVEEEIFDFLNGLIYLPQFAVSMSWSVTGIVGRCGSRK